jgi:hypothetical protein
MKILWAKTQVVSDSKSHKESCRNEDWPENNEDLDDRTETQDVEKIIVGDRKNCLAAMSAGKKIVLLLSPLTRMGLHPIHSFDDHGSIMVL